MVLSQDLDISSVTALYFGGVPLFFFISKATTRAVIEQSVVLWYD